MCENAASTHPETCSQNFLNNLYQALVSKTQKTVDFETFLRQLCWRPYSTGRRKSLSPANVGLMGRQRSKQNRSLGRRSKVRKLPSLKSKSLMDEGVKGRMISDLKYVGYGKRTGQTWTTRHEGGSFKAHKMQLDAAWRNELADYVVR